MRDAGEIRRIAGCALLAAAAAGLVLLAASDKLRVRRIFVEGGLDGAALQEVSDAARRGLTGSFFTADIEAVRSRVAALGWVTSVQVSRHWPDALNVRVGRRAAVAVWQDGQLIDQDGTLFPATDESPEVLSSLPSFSGDPRAVAQTVRGFPELRAAARRMDASVKSVDVSWRGSWKVVLEGDHFPPVEVELGRFSDDDAPAKRLARVAAVFEKAADALQGYPSAVDARYRSGFAAAAPTKEGVEMWRARRAAPSAAGE